MAALGIWSVQLVIDDTENAESETYYCKSSASHDTVKQEVESGLMAKRVRLLGRGYDDAGNIAVTAGPGSPHIRAMRLHDIGDPRKGKTYLYRRTDNLGAIRADAAGNVTGGAGDREEGFPSDALFNTIHTRFNGQAANEAADGTTLFSKRNLQLKAAPDGMQINARRAVGSSVTLQNYNDAWLAIRNYLLATSAGGMQWGMMMQAVKTPWHKRRIIAAGFDDHRAYVVLDTDVGTGGVTGIADGAQVRLSNCNVRDWNGTFQVQPAPTIAATALLLVNGPREGTPLLTAGKLRLMRDAAGAVGTVFGQFYKGEIVRISSTKAGRPFVRYRSSKSHKRKGLPKWLQAAVASS